MTSVSVRKIWDDDHNAAGIRPDHVTITLNNGMSVTLNERNGWQATITDLPLVVGGIPMMYFWTEHDVPGYIKTGMTVVGGTTMFTNSLATYRETVPPEGKPVPTRKRGENYLIIEDYGTPLGVDVAINHVGDCFD